MDFSTYGWTLVTLTCFHLFWPSTTFDQKYTGVSFTPYPKLKKDDHIPEPTEYTMENIRAMLEVITDKFSKVVTLGTGYNANRGHYIRDFTYYEKSEPEVRISEVAAEINRQRGERRITVLQGIIGFESIVETEIQVALEAAEVANKIYPGTVQGMVITNLEIGRDYKQAQQTQTHQVFIRNSSFGHLKLGIWMECSELLDIPREDAHTKLLRTILLDLDFVICKVDPEDNIMSRGPIVTFHSIASLLLRFRTILNKIYGNLEVMGNTKWSSSGKKSWNTVENLRTYWKTADSWAKNNSFPIWLHEAIDNPRRQYYSLAATIDIDAWCGWWKLTDNSKIGETGGYIEKSAKTKTTPGMTVTLMHATTNNVGLAMGMVVIIILVSLVLYLYTRGQKLQQQLSEQDIVEFRKGLSEVAIRHNYHNIDNFALQLPYDTSLEIKKEQLKIDYENILGTGQFGSVFNAQIEYNEGSSQQVALKMAKPNCPTSALKGLLSEIKILTYIGKHPNIVALKGACTKELHKGSVYIATEICTLGSLESYLRTNVKKIRPSLHTETITFHEMVKWSYEVACGMEYLGVKNVIHADLATRNVLLTGFKVAKISDFGLSRRMYNYTNYVKTQQEPLPWRWMAIESLRWCDFSVNSDIWSYGVTMWEIFSMGDTPYSGLSLGVDFVNTLIDGLRLARPKYATPHMFGYKIMTDCWNTEADERPSYSAIQNKIKCIIGECDEPGDGT